VTGASRCCLARGVGALLLALSWVPCSLASAEPATLTEPDRVEAAPGGSALTLAASAGPSVVFGEPANPEYDPSLGRVGVWLGVELAYRSSYFLEPFLEVGYGFLASGESTLPSGPWGEGGLMEQQLGMWSISPGVRTEIWRLRPELGIGMGIVTQSNDFRGETNGVSQVALFTQLGLGFTVFEAERIRVDTGLKLAAARGAGITFTTLTIAARFDALVFDGD
jgi:hypothetical protein